jgi:peptide/nickel transport system ATP-binding protein
VGLEPAHEMLDRRPFELSGGQRQRVAIARALAVEPDLLIADEPTSMLDVSIRTGVLNLLQRLQRERGLGIVLITHDLASARYLAGRILVLYRGRIVESGHSGEVVASPAHPYTRTLLSAIADAGGELRPGAAPARTGAAETGGCPFAPRCAEAIARCASEEPGVTHLGAGRQVRCFLHPQPATAPGAARP